MNYEKFLWNFVYFFFQYVYQEKPKAQKNRKRGAWLSAKLDVSVLDSFQENDCKAALVQVNTSACKKTKAYL